MPLLGFEPTTTENKQENADQITQNDPIAVTLPLLGANYLKSLAKLSQTRSSERACYDSLLRFGAHSSGLSSGKTVRNGPRGCYGFMRRATANDREDLKCSLRSKTGTSWITTSG